MMARQLIGRGSGGSMERTEQFLSVEDGLRLRYCTLGSGAEPFFAAADQFLQGHWPMENV